MTRLAPWRQPPTVQHNQPRQGQAWTKRIRQAAGPRSR